MRPISEATLAILKSQNLTGQNRFSHSLKLEGADYYSEIKEVKTVDLKQDITFLDYAIRADGKVLAAYVNTLGEVRLSTIESEEIMLSANNTVPDGVLFTTVIGGPNPISLLRLDNGKILLFVATIGDITNTPYSQKVYESASGLGTDFILKSTIYSVQRTSNAKWNSALFNSISKNIVMDDNVIFVASKYLYQDSGQDAAGFRVYKSSDNGATWQQVFQYSSGSIYWLGGEHVIKSMCYTGKFIWFTFQYKYENVNQEICYSLDGGLNWTFKAIDGWPVNNSIGRFQLDFARDKSGLLFMVSPQGNLYTATTSAADFNFLNTPANWALKVQNLSYLDYEPALLSISPKGNIHFISKQINKVCDVGMIRDEYNAGLKASSISISKGKGGSNTATIQASNKDGVLNPKNPDNPLFGILGTNKQIIIKQGYGEELVETFTGMIDDFDMSTWPQTTGIALRDNLKKALDQTVTDGNQHTVDFASQPIENIVGFLCYLADIEIGTIEATGISVAMNFSWCSYADAFQQLGDLASFEWGCDSYGKFYFRRDYQPDDMFIAYTFEEGIDLATLKYKISDKDIYSKVVVFGKSGDTVISYEAPFLDAALYNVLPQKILKIDATEASTVGALRKIAERALSMMHSRTAVVNFESIAIPWLEPGDFIGIYERSTGAASIYRLSDLSFNMDKDSFKMSGTAYYYGDSIVPGELPTDIATQTVAPTTNLIPEMTSNTAPSGVARASSIYTSNYEPWQAFNSHSDDYYWNSITNTGWIEYQFTEKTIVDKYMLKARQLTIYNDAMPRDWTFEGFDGEKWIILDRQTEQTNWGVYQSRTYLFANITAYSKYRLYVSRNDGYMRLQLEQLAMYYGGGA